MRDDREVETVEYNFDKLAFDPWHPARSPRATFFFDDERLLRTETSPCQIHALEEREPPIYMVSIGRCYRRDAIDATHYPIFHQFEGLAVDRGLTLADLKGTLLHVMRAIFGPDRRVRFRTHYFPFTEPSMEPDVSCGICGGAGCRTCRYSGWLEMGGSGMVDPRVFENVGVDPERVVRLRLRLRDRARRAAQVRLPGHPRALGGRPPRPDAVLMRVPVSWLATTSRSRCRSRIWPTRLSISAAEVEGIERRGVQDTDGNLGRFRVGRVVEAAKHPNADRLQLCRVDVGEAEPRQIVCGAWNFGAGATVAVALPGAVLPNGLELERRKVRGELSDGMILAEDEVELGPDHSGIMVLPESEPGTPLHDVLPLSTTSCSSSRPATAPTCSRSSGSPGRSRRSTSSSSHRCPGSSRSARGRAGGRRRSTTSKAAPATSAGSSAT